MNTMKKETGIKKQEIRKKKNLKNLDLENMPSRDKMKIKVKLINKFKKYGKDKLDDNRKLETDSNYFIKDLVEFLKIPEEKSKLILVNGRNVDLNYKIKDGDEIIIYNLVAGG